ncbi:MAG: phasin family protein [Pseudomonadota bacterium]|nr:phasin family protein [Pseudomonadota bacterium]
MKESAKAAAKQADAARTVTNQAVETAQTVAESVTGTAQAAASRAAETVSDVFGASKNLTFQVPAAMREIAERNVRQAKETYDRFKVVAEDATDVLEDTYANVTRSVTEVNLRALQVAQDNTNAAFDLARDLLNVRSFAEAVELHTAYLRGRFDANVVQVEELAALVNKFASDTARPAREGFERSMEQWKQAV